MKPGPRAPVLFLFYTDDNGQIMLKFWNHLSYYGLVLWDLGRQHGFWLWVVATSTAMIAGIWIFWSELLNEAQTDFSAMIRNVALVWGGIVGIGLATWRSVIAEKQAETAQANMLNDRYQKAVELLTEDKVYIRIGAIHAIRNLAFQNPQEFCERAMSLLAALQDSQKIAKRKESAEDMSDDRQFMAAQKAIEDLRTTNMVLSMGEPHFYEGAMTRARMWRKRRVARTEDKSR